VFLVNFFMQISSTNNYSFLTNNHKKVTFSIVDVSFYSSY
jgi:hypothetical protein